MNPKARRALTERGRRFAGMAGARARRAATPIVRKYGFPYVAPPVPFGVEVPEEPSTLGADYDTSWARSANAKAVRSALTAGPMRVAIDVVTRPTILGRDRLEPLEHDDVGPVIFAPNHHSHLDTALVIRAVPAWFRSNLVVAAAADYFFDREWKAAISALALNAVPIDREVTSRKSANLLRSLLRDGNNLLIYPEGGRSPDGWGQPFKGGAAYLSARTGAPIVPVFIEGTGEIFGKGATRITPGRTTVVFGRALHPDPDESTRRYNDRIAAAVERLGDEASTDYWTAARRSARGESTALTGPANTGWRRQWRLSEQRAAKDNAARRPRWPNISR